MGPSSRKHGWRMKKGMEIHFLLLLFSFLHFHPSTFSLFPPFIPSSFFPPTANYLPSSMPHFISLLPHSLSSFSRYVCSTAPWRRLRWFSRQPGRRVRPGPVTCGSPWDRPCPVWAWRGFPKPCLPSDRRAGGTSHAGKSTAE